MSQPDEPVGAPEGVHLEATAAGDSRVYQAGRDQNFHFRDGVHGIRRTGRSAVADECPYPGLAAFSSAQAEWFFGRDGLTADLVGCISDGMVGGLTMVVAPSGAGKSSLLRAGLLPALRRGALPYAGSRHWLHIVFTPTAHPLEEAAVQIAAIGSTPAAAAPMGHSGADQLTLMLRRQVGAHAEANQAAAARAVIVVDQLEELFTLCTDEQERRVFIDWLWRLSKPGTGERPLALIVCGLRADFYAECANYPQLCEALQTGQTLVGPMSLTELREAILYPAEAVGLDIEPGLVELLLRDLGVTGDRGGRAENSVGAYDAGRLPLLAHALRVTWQQRHGQTLTVDGYRATGGIRYAIATTAEHVFSRLGSTGQRDARSLFLRLVRVGESGDDVRRSIQRDDLLRESRQADVTRGVLDAYTRSRLLTQTRDAIEITHEALIREWPRLRQWIDSDRGGNLLRQDLEEAAASWGHEGGDASALYRGSRLDAARIWASDHDHDLTPTARAFLSASVQYQHRATVLRRSVSAVLAILAVVATAGAVFAFQQRTTALQQRNQAIYNQITGEAFQLSGSDPSLAAQLNLTAYRMRLTSGLASRSDLTSRLLSTENTPLFTSVTTDVADIQGIALSPDGHTLASGGDVGSKIRLWDVSDPGEPRVLGKPLAGSPDGTSSVAFSPDGRTLASGGFGGGVRLWDVTDPAHPRSLGRPLTAGNPNKGVSCVTFSRHRRLMASSTYKGTIQVWDVTDPAHPRPLGRPLIGNPGRVNTVAFSPDGRTLASGGDHKTVRLWDMTDPAHPRALSKPLLRDKTSKEAVWSVAFSPDGRTLASGSDDGKIRMWNVANPARPHRLGRPLGVGNSSNGVFSVTFSPDGATLADSNFNGRVQLWDVIHAAHPRAIGKPLTTTTYASFGVPVTFSPDGRTLVTGGGDDGAIRLWSLPEPILTVNSGVADVMTFSPDGRTLATNSAALRAGIHTAIQLWDVADPADPRPLGKPLIYYRTTRFYSVMAFSPNGRILATGGPDNKVRLWDVADPTHPRPLGKPLTAAPYGNKGVASLAFSPDSRTLASGNYDGTIRFWLMTNPAHPQPLGKPLSAFSRGTGITLLAFSPDGRTLVSSIATENEIRLWHVSDPAHPRAAGKPHITSNPFTSVAFTPDGRTLASGDTAGKIRLWDVANPVHLRTLDKPLTTGSRGSGDRGGVSSLAFSRDGRTLASGSGGTVRLWNVTNYQHPQVIVKLLNVATSGDSTVTFRPDGNWIASGSGDGTVQLWDLNVNHAIKRVCATTTNDLTPQQWRKYIHPLPYQPPAFIETCETRRLVLR